MNTRPDRPDGRRLRHRAVAGLAAAVIVGTAGCRHTPPAVSDAASSALSADVTRLQAAVTRGTATDLAVAADAVRAEVRKQQSAGALSSERGAATLDQLARVLADTAARPVPTVSPAAKVPTTPPAQRSGKNDEKDGGNKRDGGD